MKMGEYDFQWNARKSCAGSHIQNADRTTQVNVTYHQQTVKIVFFHDLHWLRNGRQIHDLVLFNHAVVIDFKLSGLLLCQNNSKILTAHPQYRKTFIDRFISHPSLFLSPRIFFR